MTAKRKIGTGLAASGFFGICCVTPVLPLLLGGAGLGGLVGFIYSDRVLLPLIALSLGLAGVGLWQLIRAN